MISLTVLCMSVIAVVNGALVESTVNVTDTQIGVYGNYDTASSSNAAATPLDICNDEPNDLAPVALEEFVQCFQSGPTIDTDHANCTLLSSVYITKYAATVTASAKGLGNDNYTVAPEHTTYKTTSTSAAVAFQFQNSTTASVMTAASNATAYQDIKTTSAFLSTSTTAAVEVFSDVMTTYTMLPAATASMTLERVFSTTRTSVVVSTVTHMVTLTKPKSQSMVLASDVIEPLEVPVPTDSSIVSDMLGSATETAVRPQIYQYPGSAGVDVAATVQSHVVATEQVIVTTASFTASTTGKQSASTVAPGYGQSPSQNGNGSATNLVANSVEDQSQPSLAVPAMAMIFVLFVGRLT